MPKRHYLLKAETGYFKAKLHIIKFIHKKIGLSISKASSIVKIGWEDSGDKSKYPEGVDRFMKIDKQNNLYTEKVIDLKTGNIIRNIKERLDRHFSRRDKKS